MCPFTFVILNFMILPGGKSRSEKNLNFIIIVHLNEKIKNFRGISPIFFRGETNFVKNKHFS